MSDTISETQSHSIAQRFSRIPAQIFWSIFIVIFAVIAIASFVSSGKQSDAERAKSISQQLRCLECEGLSVYQSDTKTSKTISSDVLRRVKAGESNKKIFSYYENIYGEYIRLAPTSEGGNWFIYVVPTFFIAVFVAAIILSVNKRSSKRTAIIFWVITGVVFVIGIGVFVHDTHVSETKTATKQEKSTKELLQESVKESPNNENLRRLGIVEYAERDYVQAFKDFGSALKYDSHDAESKGYIAHILFLAAQSDSVDRQPGEFASAQQLANEAVADDPTNVTAMFFEGIILYQIPESDTSVRAANLVQANKDFDAVLAASPDSTFAKEINNLRTSTTTTT